MEAITPLAPRTMFESYFRSADVLLKVYRLLETGEGRSPSAVVDQVRVLLAVQQDEALVWLLNDVFVGFVRERAQLSSGFFRHQNMALLLRQAVVAACTAMDIYFPELLRRYLPTMIQIKQRNFVPTARDVADFFRDFRLSLDEHLRIVEDPQHAHDELGRLLLRHVDKRGLANVSGISVTLKLLDFEDPWREISQHLGRRQNELQTQIEELVSRRNDIIHRGDRAAGSTTSTPNDILYSWTSTRLDAAKNVVLACDEMVRLRMDAYAAIVEAT